MFSINKNKIKNLRKMANRKKERKTLVERVLEETVIIQV